jgi:hypothetical protein
LLSSCIFEILKTTFTTEAELKFTLWFAFILYLWNIENNKKTQGARKEAVVICFHLVSLKYWKQRYTFTEQIRLVVICFHLVSLKYWKQLITNS